MKIQPKWSFITPWRLIYFWSPLLTLFSLGVYWKTMAQWVSPDISAYLIATSAGISSYQDLSHPLFSLVARWVAALPCGALVERMHFFTAVCSSLMLGLFYLVVARLIFKLASGSIGDGLHVLTPLPAQGRRPTARTINEANEDLIFTVQEYHWGTASVAIVGGLAASFCLMFAPPFWMSATHFYPYAFELLLIFFFLDRLISYEMRGDLWLLYPTLFLLCICCLESPLLLILMPLGIAYAFYSVWQNGDLRASTITPLVAACGLGYLAAIALILTFAKVSAVLPHFSLRLIFNTWQQGILNDVLSWVPQTGWGYLIVQVLLPTIIAMPLFALAFKRHTMAMLLTQIALLFLLLPNLLGLHVAFFEALNLSWLMDLLKLVRLDASLWYVTRGVPIIPIYHVVLIALYAGVILAIWWSMHKETHSRKDADEDEDEDYYGQHISILACRLGSLLRWVLLLLVLFQPVLNKGAALSQTGCFADQAAARLYEDLGSGSWLVDCDILASQLLIKAHQNDKRVYFVATDTETSTWADVSLREFIEAEPSLTDFRPRLINAAEISPSNFLREWLNYTPEARQKIALFKNPELLRNNGFRVIPKGFFMQGYAADEPLDILEQHRQFNVFLEEMTPLITVHPGELYSYAQTRFLMRQQVARVANELACELHFDKHPDEAFAVLRRACDFDNNNLVIALNTYELALGRTLPPEELEAITNHLRQVLRRYDPVALSEYELQQQSGTLLSLETLALARRTLWVQPQVLQRVQRLDSSFSADPQIIARYQQEEFLDAVKKDLHSQMFSMAERKLNILLEMDPTNHFVLVSKAYVTMMRNDWVEAEVWLDEAREQGVAPQELIWHEAAMLNYEGKVAEAKARVEAALVENPEEVRLWILLAQILLENEGWHDLEHRVYPMLHSMITVDDHFILHVIRGYFAKNDGEAHYIQARAWFLKALASNPEQPAIEEELLRLDDFMAVPTFTRQDALRVLRKNPEHAYANALWGMVRLFEKQYSLAADLFERSRASPQAPQALVDAGMAALALHKKEWQEALTLAQRSLALDAQRLSTHEILIQAYLATQRYQEADACLRPLLSQHPTNDTLKLLQIELLSLQGHTTEAYILLSEFIVKFDYLPATIRPQVEKLQKSLGALQETQ